MSQEKKDSPVIGFQVVNSEGDNWDHMSFEVIESSSKAQEFLQEANAREPESGWRIQEVKEGEVEDPSFI